MSVQFSPSSINTCPPFIVVSSLFKLNDRALMEQNTYAVHRRRQETECSPIDPAPSRPHSRLPGLASDGNTVFDFSDPHFLLSAEAFMNALDSRSTTSSPHHAHSIPTTPTKAPNRVGIYRPADSSFRNSVQTKIDEVVITANSLSASTKGPVSTELSSRCDMEEIDLTTGASTRFSSINLPEPVTCTCVPGVPVLCECAVQAIRIQRQLLHCRHQLLNETKRMKDFKVAIEAYRIALENQFKRNRSLSSKLASVLPLIPRESYADTPFAEPHKKTVNSNLNIFEISEPVLSTKPASEILHDLLLWFHRNLDNVAVTVNKLNSAHSCSCSGNPRCYTTRSDKFSDRSSWDNLCYTSADAEYRRPIARHLSTNSKRRLARIRDARSMTDLSVGADDPQTVKASMSSLPSRFTQSGSPELIRKRYQSNPKVTHLSGAAAKVRSRCRSVDAIPTLNPADASRDHAPEAHSSDDGRSGLSVMSELVMKLSELSELLTKQELLSEISNPKH